MRLGAIQTTDMKSKRPGVVLVFAIANIIFGLISVKLMLAAGLMEISAFVLGGMAHSAALRPHPRIGFELMAVFAVAFVFILMLQVLLIVTGIGLFSMKGWARKWCINYSIIIIGYSLVYLIYIALNPSCFHSDIHSVNALRRRSLLFSHRFIHCECYRGDRLCDVVGGGHVSSGRESGFCAEAKAPAASKGA